MDNHQDRMMLVARRRPSAAHAVLFALALAGCGDADDPAAPAPVDNPAAPALVGSWVIAAGQVDQKCDAQAASQAAFGRVEVTATSAGISVKTSGGCELNFAVTDQEASLLPNQSCIVTTMQGEATQRYDSGTLRLRGDDEAVLEAKASMTTSHGACTLDISNQLTRAEVEAALAPPTVVASAPGPIFFESVESAPDGTLYVTSLRDRVGEILRVAPGESTFTSLVQYPGYAMGNLVLDDDGVLYTSVTGMEPGALRAIARVDGDKLTVLATLPEESRPNGFTVTSDGTFYLADSNLGRVWRLRPGESAAEVWSEGGLLAVDPSSGLAGPNGLKAFEGSIYVANTSQLSVVRIPIQEDGSAGTPVKHASGVPLDDFAFDAEGNLYGTTHPFNGLLRVSPDGSTRFLHGTNNHMWGPTAAIFGAGASDGTALYVVTDGNLLGSQLPPPFQVSPEVKAAELVRVDLGVEGAPVPDR